MTRKKLLFTFLSIVIVVGVTITINQRVNQSLEDAYGVEEELYSMGEWIPFGNNRQNSYEESIEGYSIRVDEAEILTYEALLDKIGQTEETISSMMDGNTEWCPEKVLFVTVTILNENSEADGVVLDELSCYGVNYDMNMDITLTIISNDFLMEAHNSNLASYHGFLGCSVSSGAEAEVYLVYDFYEGFFSRRHWENLDDESIWLDMTWFPVRKTVELVLQE